MRAPMSWLREYAALPPEVTGRELAERLVALGLEVETVDDLGAEISGPVVVGRVRSFDEETHKNGKTVRWCQVDVGEDGPRGIVCGALNFAVGDLVVVALPGAVLPGGFEIGARKTYGHVSDGMICSTLELRVGDDHTGILVLSGEHEVGADAVEALGLRDEVLDIAVTPDRSYCLSVRGIAREAATAYGVAFSDPAEPQPGEDPVVDGGGHPAVIEDPGGADRLVLRTVTGLDPAAPTPWWLAQRLLLCGMRPVSLAVDVTNYVMLELGQPLHAFDRGRLQGAVRVRSARDGETLETLDHVRRDLDPDDLVIADDSGVIGLAGTMGGLATEITPGSTDLVLEAAHFVPARVGRTARRHKLPSEASKRFERGADPELPPVASARAVRLLADLGGARSAGSAEADQPRATRRILLDPARPGRTAGFPVDRAAVVCALRLVGAVVEDEAADPLPVVPPTWRPDLRDQADLDEEVIRVEGYDRVPAVLPVAPAGRGLTHEQRLRRRVGLALAHRGYVEAPSTPFVGADAWDAFGLAGDDPRRRALRLANPLSDEAPLLRTTLLPGLLAALRRNVGRGTPDAALFEVGLVFRPETLPLPAAPRPPVDRRPSPEEVEALDAALPGQPWRVAAVLAGRRERDGWWGPGRDATWADAVEAARAVAAQAHVRLDVRADEHPPWHPGRCAALLVGDELVGHAGELHPRVVEALDLPARTCAMELELGRLGATHDPVPAPALSTYPVATQDVALVVAEDVPAATVESALRDGAGELLESLRLFDRYRGAQVGEGRVSLAYALRFRAPDRTLTAEEVGAARAAAVAEAARRCGAEQRGA
jgi:phenylalanyl-tRNA synthetase beta chain